MLRGVVGKAGPHGHFPKHVRRPFVAHPHHHPSAGTTKANQAQALPAQAEPSTSFPSDLTPDEARAVGCLLGSMCGDILAAPALGQKAHRVVAEFPRGLTDFYEFGLDSEPGTYTGVSRQLLALAKCLASNSKADAAAFADAYSDMFDFNRTYLPYDRIVFTVLNLNRVFNSMVAALGPVLRSWGVDPATVDHKMYILWFREYVDIFGNLGAYSDMRHAGELTYLGIDEESSPDELYDAYQQRLTTRTRKSDPLGLRRFSGLVTSDEAYVRQAASDFALYVDENYEYSYKGIMTARGYIRNRLQASPPMVQVLSHMWTTFANAIRLPAQQTEIPGWWFSRLFSRSVDPETQDIGIVEELLGSSADELASRLSRELSVYSYTYTTMERMQGNGNDCGAPSRAAAVGLAARTATVPEIRHIMQAALQCSHPQSTALDAATIQAAAVQWLRTRSLTDPDCTPECLLNHLLQAAGTSEMRSRLVLVLDHMFLMSEVTDWRDGFRSSDWHQLLKVHQWCSKRGFASDAVDGVAIALLCLCCNWRNPQQAVTCAVHLGGWTCVTAALTGALVGALHGVTWLPSSWWHKVENGGDGRDMAVELGQRLSKLDIKPVALHTGANAADEALAWYA